MIQKEFIITVRNKKENGKNIKTPLTKEKFTKTIKPTYRRKIYKNHKEYPNAKLCKSTYVIKNEISSIKKIVVNPLTKLNN